MALVRRPARHDLAAARRRAATRVLDRRSRRWGRPEKITAALGGLALVTLAGVAISEFGRVYRRASEQLPQPESIFGTAEQATLATREAAAVAVAGYRGVPQREVALFNMLAAFVASFGLVRFSTWGIRGGWWPFGEVRLAGRHIHHFLPGILLSFAAGGTALVTRDPRKEQTLAIPFGIGLGLTFDEFALLLDLEDVYWTREGLVSVQISAAFAALLGAVLLGLRIVRRGEEEVLEG
jgi:hypothetical protein